MFPITQRRHTLIHNLLTLNSSARLTLQKMDRRIRWERLVLGMLLPSIRNAIKVDFITTRVRKMIKRKRIRLVRKAN